MAHSAAEVEQTEIYCKIQLQSSIALIMFRDDFKRVQCFIELEIHTDDEEAN
jgi:hypothetical protein